SMSNAAYRAKRQQLRKSVLVLNDYFDDAETWDEDSILQRSAELFSSALLIWPAPTDMSHQQVGEDPRVSEVDTLDAPADDGAYHSDYGQLCLEVAELAEQRGIDRVNRIHTSPPWFALMNMRGWPKTLHYEFRTN